MDKPNHVSRKFVAIIPLLLICGIIAQTVLLIMAVILYVPALVWPALLNGIYRTITKAMARLFAQSIFGKRQSRNSQAGMVRGSETIPLSGAPGEVPPARRASVLQWRQVASGHPKLGGTVDEWQQQNGKSIRVGWFVMLGEALEQIEARYVMNEIDRDEYVAQLRELDGKLGIVGMSLANKPWREARV